VAKLIQRYKEIKDLHFAVPYICLAQNLLIVNYHKNAVEIEASFLLYQDS
jgi:hypothetical protein